MRAVRRIIAATALLLLPLLPAACNDGSRDTSFAWLPIYGDNYTDTTPVVARVAGVEITEQDIDLRLDEMPPNVRNRYQGPEGRRLLLKDMVDQALLARGAVDLELYNDREVARTLISQRRVVLDAAMRNLGLLAKNQPTEEDLRAYFLQNRDRYRQLGAVQARHVECRTEADARAAYVRLQRGGPKDTFPHVVAEFSVNPATKLNAGELGWFNRDGFIPEIPATREFTRAAFDLADGVNPPFQVGGRWHVVEIQRREAERPMTFAEARDKVIQDIKPGFSDNLVRDWLAEARRTYPPELYGQYAPGGGLTPEQIFARAMALPAGQDKIDLFLLIASEYPGSDRADDGLFMAAQVYLDKFSDRRSAAIQLGRLVEAYPESELVDDARYMLENLDNPSALSPKSIEELRR